MKSGQVLQGGQSQTVHHPEEVRVRKKKATPAQQDPPRTGTDQQVRSSPWVVILTARGMLALVVLWTAVALPTAAPGPLAVTAILAALGAGRWWRGEPWRWLPDVFLVCLPYWTALSFRLGPTPPPAWLLGCTLIAMVVILAFPRPRQRRTRSPAQADAPRAEWVYPWAVILRHQARGLYQALPVAVVSLVLFGFFLVTIDRGFDRAALLRYLGHLGLFFAGVPLTLTAVYGRSFPAAQSASSHQPSPEATPTPGSAARPPPKR